MNEYRKSNPAKRLMYSAKKRAKASGIEFTITEKDIIVPEYCPVFGTPLDLRGGSQTSYHNSPSLDRIDSSKGYIPGNVAVISNRANRIKNDATPEELEAVLRWMKS